MVWLGWGYLWLPRIRLPRPSVRAFWSKSHCFYFTFYNFSNTFLCSDHNLEFCFSLLSGGFRMGVFGMITALLLTLLTPSMTLEFFGIQPWKWYDKMISPQGWTCLCFSVKFSTITNQQILGWHQQLLQLIVKKTSNWKIHLLYYVVITFLLMWLLSFE